MRREFQKMPDGTGKIRFLMEMDSEAGEFERTFPIEMPAGHRLQFRWATDGGVSHNQRYVEFYVEPIPAAFSQPTETGKALAEIVQGDADAIVELKALEAMTEPQRLEKAAELGLGNVVKKDQTPAKQAAAIMAGKAKAGK